jgi:hypothetical protein
VVARALAKSPEARFSSAESMIDALTPFTRATPTGGGRPGRIWIASTAATLTLGAIAFAAATRQQPAKTIAVDASAPVTELATDAAPVTSEKETDASLVPVVASASAAPTARRRPHVALRFSGHSGGLPSVVVGDIMQQLKPHLVHCYEAAGWSTHAEHSITVTVNGNGAPVGVSMTEGVAQCAVLAFMRLRFRPWEGTVANHVLHVVVDPM